MQHVLLTQYILYPVQNSPLSLSSCCLLSHSWLYIYIYIYKRYIYIYLLLPLYKAIADTNCMKDAVSNKATLWKMLERIVWGAAHYSNDGKCSVLQENIPQRCIPETYKKIIKSEILLIIFPGFRKGFLKRVTRRIPLLFLHDISAHYCSTYIINITQGSSGALQCKFS